MYESVRIQNFRGFEDLTVDGLTRVNLVVGKNNVGKSSLLEALFLMRAAGNFLVPDILGGLRGLKERGRIAGGAVASAFHDFDLALTVSVLGREHDQPAAEDSLEMLVGIAGTESETRDRSELLQYLRKGLTVGPTLPLSLDMRWVQAGQEVSHIRVSENPEGDREGQPWRPHELSFAPPRRAPAALQTTRFGWTADEALYAYSMLVRMKRKDRISDALKILDDRIRDPQILDAAGGPTLHVDVGLPQPVPLALLGEGTVRLVSLVLGMVQATDGLLLVDEIDTGLHYSALRRMWQITGEVAVEQGAQIIATTHSYECMVAAYEAFADHPEEFSMHRLERRKDGRVVSKNFGHEDLGTALELGFEVR